MKKILVAGAGGFWGSHLSRALAKKGYSVFATYHKRQPHKSAGLKYFPLDVTKPDEVKKIIKKIKPDAVCYLAGQSSLGQAWKLEELTFSLNTWACLNFLKAIQTEIPRARFVYASTIHVYGKMLLNAKKPLTENSLALPEGPYGVSKRVSELLCLDFYNRFKLDTVMIRPVNCIGPGLSRHFAFSDWCAQIAACEKESRAHRVLRVGNLNVFRDFLHIEDAVRGFILALEKGAGGEVYNLSSQKVLKLQAFADFLLQKSAVSIRIVKQKQRLRHSEPLEIHVSSKKLRRLGWKTKRTAFEGLDELLSECRGKKFYE